ncbi:probable salivary secreted peptide [Pectinophora gossypiella]|uniref:Salivary secreted peptide n=1 Tax=Pectinophora gossypiella TaxID=13191 RepID=A0A1E1WKF6_PECGO|nr:probable salivary secreted peptide [Pectinophora gossypiella]
MKSIYILGVLVLVCVSSCVGKDLIVGNSFNTRLLWQQKAEYMGIPFKKRVKEVFFSDPGQQVIRAIIARDVDHTDASATVTAGGVGSTFANLRLKSERGSGLNYIIEIYA